MRSFTIEAIRKLYPYKQGDSMVNVGDRAWEGKR